MFRETFVSKYRILGTNEYLKILLSVDAEGKDVGDLSTENILYSLISTSMTIDYTRFWKMMHDLKGQCHENFVLKMASIEVKQISSSCKTSMHVSVSVYEKYANQCLRIYT